MPAHQGTKIGCMGRWKGSGVASAPHPSPGWGQAPALHFSVDPRLVAGTPRYENWVHWLMEGFRCRLCPPPLPWLGTSPQPYISPLTLGRCRHTKV